MKKEEGKMVIESPTNQIEHPIEDNLRDKVEENVEVINSMDYDCISADFSDDMLSLEMMKFGCDPANLNREQMIEMLYEKMVQQKQKSL